MPGTGRMACMLRCTGGSVIVRARERTRARGRGWADRCARGGGVADHGEGQGVVQRVERPLRPVHGPPSVRLDPVHRCDSPPPPPRILIKAVAGVGGA